MERKTMPIEVGTDIVDISRIKKIIDKNEGFLERVFNNEEIKYCRTHKNYAEHFAVRFAAKEAVIKALDKKEIPLKNISIIHKKSGKPLIKLDGKWKKLEKFLSVSLSHCDKYAVAFVTYMRRNSKS
jgi:holo-[acyl-carrier protein] synthase